RAELPEAAGPDAGDLRGGAVVAVAALVGLAHGRQGRPDDPPGAAGWSRRYGESEDRWASTRSAWLSGGKARCGHAGRSHMRQPDPILVAASTSSRSRPCAYTVRWAWRASQPRPMANVLRGWPKRIGRVVTVRETHRWRRS